jgi:hypothetical protein
MVPGALSTSAFVIVTSQRTSVSVSDSTIAAGNDPAASEPSTSDCVHTRSMETVPGSLMIVVNPLPPMSVRIAVSFPVMSRLPPSNCWTHNPVGRPTSCAMAPEMPRPRRFRLPLSPFGA